MKIFIHKSLTEILQINTFIRIRIYFILLEESEDEAEAVSPHTVYYCYPYKKNLSQELALRRSL